MEGEEAPARTERHGLEWRTVPLLGDCPFLLHISGKKNEIPFDSEGVKCYKKNLYRRK